MFQKIINKLNDLRPRQLLILAFGAAALMFVILYAAMNLLVKKEEVVIEKTKYSTESTSVVIAKANIPPRTRIQENMLQLKEVPVELVPEGAITNFNDVKDVQVKVSIFAGDILTVQKVFSKMGDDGFVGTIPPDCRAISISVNDVTGVAGFAKPGDFVDLLLSERSPYSATTTILLQNVPLLSINQDMTGAGMTDAGGSAINNPTIATFALNPEDTLKLISATKLGEIYMSLRPAEPRNNYVPAMEYTLESVNMPPPEPEPTPAPQSNIPVIPENSVPVMPLPQIPANVPVTPPVPKIEIIQGDEITQKAEEEDIPTSMPVIPSGAETPTASQPVVSNPSSNPKKLTKPLNSAPLSGSRVVQSFMQ